MFLNSFKKVLSSVSILALLWGQVLFPSLVLAQEITPGETTPVENAAPSPAPKQTHIPSETPIPSEEPSSNPSPTPESSNTPLLDENLETALASESAVIVDNTASGNEPSAAVTSEIWKTNEDGSSTTISPVVLNQTYKAPQNDKVTVTFTKLPENPGTLTIKQIILSQEDKEDLGAVSDTAYDITSNMENGTFEYVLTLPAPKTDNVEVKASEDGQTFVTLGGVTAQTETVTITGLDHFTVFVLVNDLDNGGSAATTDDIANGVLTTIKDAWIDETAANQDTNHGNAKTLQVRSRSPAKKRKCSA